MKMSIPAETPRTATPLRAVVGAASTTVVCVVPVFLVGGLAVQIGRELHFNPAGLGLALSSYFAISAVTSVPSGSLVERFGSTLTARIGVLLSAAGLAAIAVARTYPAFLALLALAGVGNALGQLASNAVLAARVPAVRQGLSFGIKQAAVPAAALLAGLAVPGLGLTLGWRWAFAVGAGLAVAVLPVVPPDGHRGRRTAGDDGERATAALVVIGAAALLGAGSASALSYFLVDSAVAAGLDPALAGLTLTAGSAVCVTVRVLGGWLADRYPDGHLTVVAGSIAGGAVGLGLVAAPPGPALLAGVLLGFGLGWAWPGLLNFAVVRLHPQAPAAATSITQTGVYAGGCIGPFAFGATAAGAGYPAAWLGAAVAMLCSSVLMLAGRQLLSSHAESLATRRAALAGPRLRSAGRAERGSAGSVGDHVAHGLERPPGRHLG